MAGLGTRILPKEHQVNVRMGKQFPAAVTAQGHQADFLQVLGLRRKKLTGEIENNAVQQRRPALCGHAPVRSGSEFALDSGELLGVKIAEGGDWCRRHAHCSGSKIGMRVRYLFIDKCAAKGLLRPFPHHVCGWPHPLWKEISCRRRFSRFAQLSESSAARLPQDSAA